MNLKESFRYRNYLEELMQTAKNTILDPDVRCRTIRRLAGVETRDVRDEEEPPVYPFGVSDLVGFCEAVIAESEMLTTAINEAKYQYEFVFDIDAAKASNRMRTGFVDTLKTVLDAKLPSGEPTVTIGKNDTYVSTWVYEPAFDRGLLRNAQLARAKLETEMSKEIEKAVCSCQVHHTPLFNMDGSFNDAVADYIAWRDSEIREQA